VRAALAMRETLAEFNQGRGDDKKPIIKIGCGINTGDVIAGQIGSEQRMEYTVIGDAVNLASRTEALNKPLGTDILITENTWQLIGDKVITEEMPSVTVKGKKKPVRMFAVINVADSKEGPQNLRELRKLLGIAAPKLSAVNVNVEEKKYKIGGD
jgi:adenylate cyclase